MKLFTPLALVLALCVSTQAHAQDTGATSANLAYVDIERAIRSVEDGQQAMAELTGQLERRQTELDGMEEELRQFTATLEQELEMLDTETRNQRLAEYQQRMQQYQQLYVSNQQALVELEAEATAEIVQRMVTIVAEISESRSLSLVFEKTRSALVWGDADLDLTDELIRIYEERH